MSTVAKHTNSSPSKGPGSESSRVDIRSMLDIMKLGDKKDADVFLSLKAWVDTEPMKSNVTPQSYPTEKADVCRHVSTLLLMRLLRAFEKRVDPKENKKRRVSDPSATKMHDGVGTSTGAHRSTSTIKTTDPPTGGGKKSADAMDIDTTSTTDFEQRQQQQQQQRQWTANASVGTGAAVASMPAVTKKPPSLHEMMKRHVKVTRKVMEAVQFVGSDILKLLQVIPSSPTVADAATCALKILKDVESITDCYRRFVAANTDNNKDHLSVVFDPKDPTYFGVFALQSLQTIQAQAIFTYELAYDYDYIYETTYSTLPSFKTSVDALNLISPPTRARDPTSYPPDTEARNMSWKFTRFLSLKQDFTSDKSDQHNSETVGGKRRNGIVNAAAAIALSAELGQTNEMLSAASNASADKRVPQDPSIWILDATTQLMAFLEANTEKKGQYTAFVTNLEITAMVSNLREMMMALPFVPRDSAWHQCGPEVPIWRLPPKVQQFITQNFSRLVEDLVSSLHQALNFASPPQADRPTRTSLSRILFLFPMVIGEPWGFHRNAPTITSRQLCTSTSKTLDPALTGSVALVLKLKSNASPSSKKRQSSTNASPPAKQAKSTPNTLRISNQPPAKPRPPRIVKMSEVDPPVVNDAMELNEWTLSILSLSVIKPSDTLLTFLGEHDRRRGDSLTCLHEVIVPVLNRGISRIHKSLQIAQPAGAPITSGQIFVGKRDGRVYVNGAVNEDIQLCASVVGFFYHSLEAIMNDQLKRLEFLGPFNALMQSESFHRALLSLCYACILKGVGATQRLQVDGSYKDCTVFMLLETIESNPYTFMKVTEALCRALVVTDDEPRRVSGSPLIPGLPAMLHQYVQKIEVQLLESIIWARSMPSTKSETTLTITIKSMKSLPGSWPPDALAPLLPEELTDMSSETAKLNEVRFKPTFSASSEANFLTYVLQKVLKLAYRRIQEIFAALGLSSETAAQTQAYVAFRYCLRHHIDILFERHVDQLLLCTIYGVCKVMNITSAGTQLVVTFGQIIDAYCTVRGKEQGQRTCRVIVRHVKLASSDGEVRPKGQFFGAIIDFYNQVYVPKMQRHFLRSKSLKKSVTEYYNRSLRVLKDQQQQQPLRSQDATSSRHRAGTTISEGANETSAPVAPATNASTAAADIQPTQSTIGAATTAPPSSKPTDVEASRVQHKTDAAASAQSASPLSSKTTQAATRPTSESSSNIPGGTVGIAGGGGDARESGRPTDMLDARGTASDGQTVSQSAGTAVRPVPTTDAGVAK
jgi:Retinoblastoma-associated protein B domain/Retinoblastoma-associated protein A domain